MPTMRAWPWMHVAYSSPNSSDRNSSCAEMKGIDAERVGDSLIRSLNDLYHCKWICVLDVFDFLEFLVSFTNDRILAI